MSLSWAALLKLCYAILVFFVRTWFGLRTLVILLKFLIGFEEILQILIQTRISGGCLVVYFCGVITEN